MKPYPEYKPTGLAWLPEIPRHWTTRKIKYIFRERSEKGYPDEPLLAATQNHGVIPKSLYGARTVEAQKDLHLLKLVRVGDFVISLRFAATENLLRRFCRYRQFRCGRRCTDDQNNPIK